MCVGSSNATIAQWLLHMMCTANIKGHTVSCVNEWGGTTYDCWQFYDGCINIVTTHTRLPDVRNKSVLNRSVCLDNRAVQCVADAWLSTMPAAVAAASFVWCCSDVTSSKADDAKTAVPGQVIARSNPSSPHRPVVVYCIGFVLPVLCCTATHFCCCCDSCDPYWSQWSHRWCCWLLWHQFFCTFASKRLAWWCQELCAWTGNTCRIIAMNA